MSSNQKEGCTFSGTIVDQTKAQALVAATRHRPLHPPHSSTSTSSTGSSSSSCTTAGLSTQRLSKTLTKPSSPVLTAECDLSNTNDLCGGYRQQEVCFLTDEGAIDFPDAIGSNATATPPPVPARALRGGTTDGSGIDVSGATSAALENGWQGHCASIRERCVRMFNNELMSDVHFVVGSERVRIPGHRYVLATGSSVFYAMLYGGLAHQPGTDGDIDIPDVEPVGLLNLFHFLYCDTVELNEENVLSTLYAAKKYIVPQLSEQCVDFLQQNLTARNACLMLSQSRLFDEPNLRHSCWVIIDAQATEAIESDSFVDIDRETLTLILERQTLNCAEIDLFRAAVRWAAAECERHNLEPTPKHQNVKLGDALYLIRIPAMKLEEFANHVAGSDILSLKQVTDIFLHFTASSKPALPFPVKPRAGLTPIRCRRFHSTACRNNQWRYRGRTDSIRFQVDKRIFLGGVGLYGSSGNQTAEYGVRLELKRDGTVLGSTVTRFRSGGSGNPHPVYLDHPVQIDTDTWYTVSVVLDGSELSYFGQEGMTNVQVGHINFQFHCSPDSTNGTGVQGGQIPELIFFA